MRKKKTAKKKVANDAVAKRRTGKRPLAEAGVRHTVWALTTDQDVCDAVIRSINDSIDRGRTRYDDVSDDVKAIAPPGQMDDYMACFHTLMSRANKGQGPFRINGVNVAKA